VAQFEAAMLKFFHDQHPALVDELDRAKDLDSGLVEKISQAIRDFKSQYKVNAPARAAAPAAA
jgi:F0F1-type ATP synthase alpha subunit